MKKINPDETFKTCASLTENKQQESRIAIFQQNFTILAAQKLEQTKQEYLARVDSAVENILTRIPKKHRELKVSEFARSNNFLADWNHFAFEPPVKRPQAEEKLATPKRRTSGDILKRNVRKELADTDTEQKMFLPGLRKFISMPNDQQETIINVLTAVVATYKDLHEDL